VKKILILFLLVLFVTVTAVYVVRYIDNYARYGRFRETVAVHPHEEPLLVMKDGIVPVTDGEAFLRAAKAETLKSSLPSGDPAVLDEGRSLYFTFCAQCHGKYHDGNGTVGQSFYPLPTDLRTQRIQSLPEGVLFQAISYGIPKPDNRQPALATTIDILDRWRIVAYVKSLGPRNSNENF
jgi:mono/diheme cytochrome c family protein